MTTTIVTTATQPILTRADHDIIMNYLKTGQARTLFNRHDAEELLEELKKAVIVENDALPADVIRLNSTVQVMDQQDKKVIELTLVTPKMANIKEKKISVMSPVGTALIGYRQGQQVSWRVPSGEKRFTVLHVK